MSLENNLQIAVEEQQKAKALDKSQQSDVGAKKKGNQKQTKAAMFSQLDDLTMTLLAKDEAVKEQQKANTLDKSQQSDVGAKKKGNQKKTKAADSSHLDGFNSVLLRTTENRDKLSQEDQEKLKNSHVGAAAPGDDSDNSTPSSDKDKPKAKNSSDQKPAPTPKKKKPSMFDLIEKSSDPLIALVLAGISIQEETNKMITSLSTSGEEISKVTTEAAKAGNDWMNNYYSHGVTGGTPGTVDTDSHGVKHYYFYDSDRHKWYDTTEAPPDRNKLLGLAYIDWINRNLNGKLGHISSDPPKALSSQQQSWCKQKDNIVHGGSVRGYSGNIMMSEVQVSNSDGLSGATGTAHQKEFNELMGIWQYVQQQVSQINNKFQTVAGLPSTMMQTLTQAVTTANSGQAATVQAIGTTTNLVNGWAGV